jgi:hypothetical protein
VLEAYDTWNWKSHRQLDRHWQSQRKGWIRDINLEVICIGTVLKPQKEVTLSRGNTEEEHVLVCSGCYNETPGTEWLINNKQLLLTVLEARKSKIKAPSGAVSNEALMLPDGALPLYPPMGLLHKGTNPIHVASS